MKSVLITSIGTGLKQDGGYRTTKYRFPDGKEIETQLFLEAIIKSKYRDLDSIVVVGTNTSTWDALLTQESSHTEDLRIAIMEEVENGGISEQKLLLLGAELQKVYNIPFKLQSHTQIIDKNTIGNIFRLYHSISAKIPSGTPVLFDITHGFRSMPILMYQSMQYGSVDEGQREISLIYGEYSPDDKVSFVRDLSNYWTYAQITTALHLFEVRFDGYLLADLLSEHWRDGSKWLRNFSGAIEGNYVLQIEELARQLTNILKGIQKDAYHWWIQEIFQKFKKLEKRFQKESVLSKKVFVLAKLLGEKKMFTQAIIALQVAVEAFVLESLGEENRMGDYDFYQNIGKKHKKELFDECDLRIRNKLYDLEGSRNQIAHGGSKNKNTGHFPQAQNLKNQFNKYQEAVADLFSR